MEQCFPRAMAEQPSLWDFHNLPVTPTGSGADAIHAPEPEEIGDAHPANGEVSLPRFSPRVTQPAAAQPGCPTMLLILDTETTGLDPTTDQCLEVGAVLFHVPGRAVLSQLSFLLPADTNPARAVNGIDPAVTRVPQPWQQSLDLFQALVHQSDAVVAHNAAFDRQWFGKPPLPGIDQTWICSMEDIHWPAERHLRASPSVRDLALAYEVPVWAAHRALTDCIYLAQVFERCEDLEALLVAAMEPRQLFRAQLSYAERHRAKEAGFRWNHPVTGAWSRRLSEREALALPFPVLPVSA